MTKGPMRRVFVAIVMIAMLAVTTGVMAEEEGGGGEYTEGYCLDLATRCGSQCLGGWASCRDAGVNADTCQDQYDWCIDDCQGYADWWCGFRQV
jgi:hypothetical protein